MTGFTHWEWWRFKRELIRDRLVWRYTYSRGSPLPRWKKRGKYRPAASIPIGLRLYRQRSGND